MVLLATRNYLFLPSVVLSLDDQLQRISEELEKTGRHAPYMEDIQGADVDVHLPVSKLEPVVEEIRFNQEDLKSDGWSPRVSESTRERIPREYSKWDDKRDRGREDRGPRQRSDVDWGWDGRRAHDRRERGYGKREGGGWRRDRGWSDRPPRERSVRLDSSAITTEMWNTPLSRNIRKEK